MQSKINKKFKSKINEIRDKINESKKPIMFFDLDTDGSTSYLQLKRKYKKIIGFPLNKDFKNQKKLIEFIKINYQFEDFDLIIIFDLPFLNTEFLELVKEKNIIWVDHHPTNNIELIKKYNILHLNPLNYNSNDNRPSSYLAYLIVDDLDNLDLVSIGSTSDFFLLDVLEDFYKYDENKFNLIFKLEEKKREEIFNFIKKYKFNDKRVYKKREELIRFISYETRLKIYKNFFDFICKLDDFKDSIKAFRIIEKLNIDELIGEISASKNFPFKNYNEITNEYKKRLNIILNEYKLINSKKKRNKFYFYEYVGKMSFAKTLSEELIHKLKNISAICICFKKIGKDWYSCSLRGKNIIVNEIVTKSLLNLNGKGGGHPFAAGVSINKNDYHKFKKRIIEYFQNKTKINK